MLRTVDVILICGMLGAAAWTFKVKNDAQVVMQRVENLEKQISEEKAEISLLRADWSLFTSPDRLQKLVDKFQEELKLLPVEPSQMATMKLLPPYKRDDSLPHSPLMDGFAEADRNIKTGSIPLVGGNIKPKGDGNE